MNLESVIDTKLFKSWGITIGVETNQEDAPVDSSLQEVLKTIENRVNDEMPPQNSIPYHLFTQKNLWQLAPSDKILEWVATLSTLSYFHTSIAGQPLFMCTAAEAPALPNARTSIEKAVGGLTNWFKPFVELVEDLSIHSLDLGNSDYQASADLSSREARIARFLVSMWQGVHLSKLQTRYEAVLSAVCALRIAIYGTRASEDLLSANDASKDVTNIEKLFSNTEKGHFNAGLFISPIAWFLSRSVFYKLPVAASLCFRERYLHMSKRPPLLEKVEVHILKLMIQAAIGEITVWDIFRGLLALRGDLELMKNDELSRLWFTTVQKEVIQTAPKISQNGEQIMESSSDSDPAAPPTAPATPPTAPAAPPTPPAAPPTAPSAPPTAPPTRQGSGGSQQGTAASKKAKEKPKPKPKPKEKEKEKKATAGSKRKHVEEEEEEEEDEAPSMKEPLDVEERRQKRMKLLDNPSEFAKWNDERRQLQDELLCLDPPTTSSASGRPLPTRASQRNTRSRKQENPTVERAKEPIRFEAFRLQAKGWQDFEVRPLEATRLTMAGILNTLKKYRVDSQDVMNADTDVDLGWLFISPWSIFTRKTTIQQRDILARATVCIHSMPVTAPPMTICNEDLQTLGDLFVKRDMQSPYLRDEAMKQSTSIHLRRSLVEFKEQYELGERGELLNAIDLPQTDVHQHPLIVSQFATHEIALRRTEFALADMEHADARQGLNWSLLGMAGVDSHDHVDFGGADTYVEPHSGLKAWVVMHRGYEPDAYIRLLQRWLKDGLEIGLDDDDDETQDNHRDKSLQCAFLMLEPGTVLLMRGCTEHYVLTVETSIVTGGQFIPAARMKASVVGLIHTMLLDYVVTNITHLNFWALYARILIYWFDRVKKDNGLNDVVNIHVPNYRSPEGLSNIVALGNLMLFGSAILLPHELADVVLEIETAKDCYLRFIQWHGSRFQTRCATGESYFSHEALHFIQSLLHFSVIVSQFPIEIRIREVHVEDIIGNLQKSWKMASENGNFLGAMGDAPNWDELRSEAIGRAEDMDAERDSCFFGPLACEIIPL